MIPYRTMLLTFVVAVVGYVALSFALFKMPESIAAAEDCGFLPEEFLSPGNLTYARTDAFLISFMRKQEFLTAATVGIAAAFAAFALRTGRKGGAASAGITAGGGLLAFGAICVSCLAPVLSVVGLGVIGSLLAGVPKWVILLNTLALTGWGTLFLSRRAMTCTPPPLSNAAAS